MFARRMAFAILTATMLATTVVAAPVMGRDPMTRPIGNTVERPLTAAERAASERRIAEADANLRAMADSGQELLPLACVTPQSTSAPLSTSSPLFTSAPADPRLAGCAPPQGFLSVEARDQQFGHYCGPAVGQVVANYAWNMAPGANKYTQGLIAGWMGTDANGQTNATSLEIGLERSTANAPRRPAGWDWVVTDLRDRDGDRASGDELHGYIRSNISVARMPMAIPVKPHDRFSQFFLPSWPRTVNSVGHWIGIYGWLGLWNGGDTARAYYTDSSRDEGGATGKFWLPTRHLAALIGEHTGRFVW